ncbi:hypothetical protein GCM10018772_34070 [Streptomyces fumanus]|uniref:Uncharacterized protein n=1 Tax=Streptomyces fumanus TaxID=67302 RepID=A0A919AFY5_9ACTN|nr:hypothetical protein GCM10018772_34070 [Streptomyces fumanus]
MKLARTPGGGARAYTCAGAADRPAEPWGLNRFPAHTVVAVVHSAGRGPADGSAPSSEKGEFP